MLSHFCLILLFLDLFSQELHLLIQHCLLLCLLVAADMRRDLSISYWQPSSVRDWTDNTVTVRDMVHRFCVNFRAITHHNWRQAGGCQLRSSISLSASRELLRRRILTLLIERAGQLGFPLLFDHARGFLRKCLCRENTIAELAAGGGKSVRYGFGGLLIW